MRWPWRRRGPAPLCSACVHYVPGHSSYINAVCGRYTNLVDGTHDHSVEASCRVQRKKGFACGPEGRYFKPKEGA